VAIIIMMREERGERGEHAGGKEGEKGGGRRGGDRRGFVRWDEKGITSVFFTNFPEATKAGNLWPKFAAAGNIGEVFIPIKRDKQGRRFGFAKFREVKDHEELMSKLSDI
jgi:hypothetical protein